MLVEIKPAFKNSNSYVLYYRRDGFFRRKRYLRDLGVNWFESLLFGNKKWMHYVDAIHIFNQLQSCNAGDEMKVIRENEEMFYDFIQEDIKANLEKKTVIKATI